MWNRYVVGKCLDASLLDKAIEATQLAAGSGPKSSGDSELLIDLGFRLGARFLITENVDDLHRAIPVLQRTLELSPNKGSNKAELLHLLGMPLLSFFKRKAILVVLDCAVLAARCAVALTTHVHSREPDYLYNLGSSLRVRFQYNGNLNDIGQSIAALGRAVELTPDGHPDKPLHYDNLGVSLRVRFQRNGDLGDIEKSIAAHRRAVELTLDGHAAKPACYSNLGNSLRVRFERNGDLKDIEQSIAAHLHKPSRYNNLGISLQVRFERNGNLDDIEQSITALRRAVELTPDGHSDKPARYNNLGNALNDRCKSKPTRSNFDMAVQAYMEASAQPLGSSSLRLSASRQCVRLHSSHPSFATRESLLLALSYVVAVLPEVVWLGHDIHRRFDESAKLGELVNIAVSGAIAARSLEQAVEWSEAGRALIWSQVLSLRTPLDDLWDAHPRLAESLQDVQQQLQQSAPTSFTFDVDSVGSVAEFESNPGADRHRGHAIKYDALLKEIRDCTGFEDFLRPKRFEALVPAPELMSGPVVFINVAGSCSDALILTPGGKLASVALPDLSFKRARDLRTHWTTNLNQRKMRVRGVDSLDELEDDFNPLHALLESIWTWIVDPILKALDMPNPIHNERLPHITWCPTGPLTQLPLHAAGVYSDPDGPRVFDFVVSSYTPSLAAFLRSAEAVAKHQHVPKTLVLTQPDTPHSSPLPGTHLEGRRLQEVLAGSQIDSTLLEHTKATVAAVKSAINQYPWIHFACHGKQHSGDPTQSAFALYDGPLSLAALMSTTAENAELAFLSACQTATGDEKNPEESAHLAAGMLAVGFKGVAATLWSIGDRDAPIVVEAYYKELLKLRESGTLGKGETGAAYALHEAVRVLRERLGENKFVRWAPFVHFGV
ncbi:hypothetical protein PENSPDRAFT_568231 [Peniophora sp. CONT]|nr:hypothetical protein PENSPDRAFT_568231 [Peniophora sp. CONT]